MRFGVLLLIAGLTACGSRSNAKFETTEVVNCKRAFAVLDEERASGRINVYPVINDVKKACRDVLRDDDVYIHFAKQAYLATYPDPSLVKLEKTRLHKNNEGRYLENLFSGEVKFKNADGSFGHRRLFHVALSDPQFEWSTHTYEE